MMPLVKRTAAPAQAPSVPKPTFEKLVSDLKSAEADVRRNAARGLAEHPQAAEPLCGAIASEELESVREAIFTALIRIGNGSAVEGLIPLLHSEDVALRNGATEALKAMPDAVSGVFDQIFAGPADVRIFGVEILGALAHPSGPQRLIQVIEEAPEINVCAAAVDALAECGNAEAIGPLRRLLERFPDEPFLEFSVTTALARIANA